MVIKGLPELLLSTLDFADEFCGETCPPGFYVTRHGRRPGS
jgi:hypothetical protein